MIGQTGPSEAEGLGGAKRRDWANRALGIGHRAWGSSVAEGLGIDWA
ncbi:hypothetical protein [Microcoleus sp. CZ3-B4]